MKAGTTISRYELHDLPNSSEVIDEYGDTWMKIDGGWVGGHGLMFGSFEITKVGPPRR